MHITFTQRDMHQRYTRAEEQILHELIGFTRLVFGNGLHQLNPDRGLEGCWVTQQKIHVFAKDLVEKMDVFIRAHDVKNIVQRQFSLFVQTIFK